MTDRSSAADSKFRIDSPVPHSTRVWNYFLGGKDYYPVDCAVGNRVKAMFPDITRVARARWRPEPSPFPDIEDVPSICGVGR